MHKNKKMKKILVVGASGGLGRKVVEGLKGNDYFVKALVKHPESVEKIKDFVDEVIVGDASRPESINGICDQVDIVFSALGKNVSLFSDDDKNFFQTDYSGNANILEEAKKSDVPRFVYVSIYGSNFYSGEFEIAKVHKNFEDELSHSKIDHSIIRPVGIFVGLLDVLRMAKNGLVISIGTGKNKTNPIHEDDLAAFCINHLEKGPKILEVGGPVIYTRDQIAELAIQAAGGSAQHLYLPETIVDAGLPLIKMYDQNFFDKLAFFDNVLTHDVVAPLYGSKQLEDYFFQMVKHTKGDWVDLFF